MHVTVVYLFISQIKFLLNCAAKPNLLRIIKAFRGKSQTLRWPSLFNSHPGRSISHTAPRPGTVKWSNTKAFVWQIVIKQEKGISCRIGLCYIFTPDSIKTHTLRDLWSGVMGKSSLMMETTTSLLSSGQSSLKKKQPTKLHLGCRTFNNLSFIYDECIS